MSRRRLLEVLGLHGRATVGEIKKRYRELARRYHPDLNAGDERAAVRFKAIRSAYEALLVASGTEPDGVDDIELLTKRKVAPTVEGVRSPNERAPTADRVARMIADRRAKLAKSKRELERLQADVTDGEAKGTAARKRGDIQMARHFERRVDADRSRVYALLGEVAGLERELEGLEFRASQGGSESRLVKGRTENVQREARQAFEDELAAIKNRYERDKEPR